MNDLVGISLLIFLLLANAFFVAAEFAVISARRSTVEPLANKGKKSAIKAIQAMENATDMLATCQLGITICSLLILGVSEPAIHHVLSIPLKFLGLPEVFYDGLSLVLAIIIVSYLHVVFGEMVPKNISFSMPLGAVLLLAPPLLAVAKFLKPLVWLLNYIANGVLKLFSVPVKSETNSAYTLDEVLTIVSQSTKEGVLEDNSGTLSAAFEFTEKKVSDVMITREKLVAFYADKINQEDIEIATVKYGYSRYIVLDNDSNAIGYVHVKDSMLVREEKRSRIISAKRIRILNSVSSDTDLEDALALFQRTGAHLAKVSNKNAEYVGIIFFEDIIEELVGEIHDNTRRNNQGD